jgi:hypothetical protein
MKTSEAIKAYGAKAVSDAAYRAMNGDRSKMERIGLAHVRGLVALNEVAAHCFALMSNDEKAQDLSEAAISAAKLK